MHRTTSKALGSSICDYMHSRKECVKTANGFRRVPLRKYCMPVIKHSRRSLGSVGKGGLRGIAGEEGRDVDGRVSCPLCSCKPASLRLAPSLMLQETVLRFYCNQ